MSKLILIVLSVFLIAASPSMIKLPYDLEQPLPYPCDAFKTGQVMSPEADETMLCIITCRTRAIQSDVWTVQSCWWTEEKVHEED